MVHNHTGAGAESRRKQTLATRCAAVIVVGGGIDTAGSTEGIENLLAVHEAELNEHSIDRRIDKSGRFLNALRIFPGKDSPSCEFLQKSGLGQAQKLEFPPGFLEAFRLIGDQGDIDSEDPANPRCNGGMNRRPDPDAAIQHREQSVEFAKKGTKGANDQNTRSRI
jgi:hypothetical protein